MQLKEVKNAAISITLKWWNTLLGWGIDFLFKLASTFTTMHQSYEYKLGHPADFRVKYRFYSIEEGRKVLILRTARKAAVSRIFAKWLLHNYLSSFNNQ